MRIKLSLALPDGTTRPTAVTTDATATVAAVAGVVQAGLTGVPTRPDQTLTFQLLADTGEVDATLPPRSLVVETVMRSGQLVRVVPWVESKAGSGASAPARLRVIAGPNAGQNHTLRLGPNVIGRDQGCDVVLEDRLVSRRHARVMVTDRVEIADMNSSNGVLIGDGLVDHAVLGPRDTIQLGDSTVIVEQNPDRMAQADLRADLEFNRSPLVRPPFKGSEFAAPKPPARPKPSRFPLVAMAAPVVMGLVLFMATRNIMSIMFVALSPLIAVGTWFDRKVTDEKSVKADRKRFDDDVQQLRADLAAALDQEHEARLAEVLSLDALMESAFSLNPDLWHRRPEDESFLTLNLGYGRTESRHRFVCPERGEADAETWGLLNELRQQCAQVNDVPIVARLRDCGNVGVAGDRLWLDPLARNLVAQLACLHSPAEVVLAAVASAESAPRWNWLMWLPHVGSTHSPLAGPHLAGGNAGASSLVTALEELVAARSAVTGLHIPAVVVIVEDDAPVERGRLVALAEKGPAAGVHLVWLAEHHAQLPAACHSYLVRSSGGDLVAGFVKEQRTAIIHRIETLEEPMANGLARQLAPVLDAGAPVLDQSDLPRAVSYLSLAGTALAEDPQVTVERWRENGSLLGTTEPRSKTTATLRALIGQGTQGEFTLDLRSQGPHALVGGTTGAGKSEFLQAWVLGMAASHSPQRVTFLFVDYKGGSAFADCVKLPHTVGLVTDLSPHLVKRALTSLRAELRFREHLLNRKKAKDLITLERTGDPECPPALIVVVDEFAALVNDVPEFVDGVVDVAQRGRSLGIHLILATQRPSGVITPNLRANTNLRVALRMADESDSADVIDSTMAGEFDPRVPGRGAVRTGPGRIALFQTGYAGGRTSSEPEPPRIEVETMTFGAGTPWEIPEGPNQATSNDVGPVDITRVVTQVRAAAGACGIGQPRKPWLPELANTFDLVDLIRSDQTRSVDGQRLMLGVADNPENQDQHPVYFDPDRDGNLAVFGGSGAGKSAVLRTLAVGAALQQTRTEVYGLDFATAGLAMISPLPNVGAVIDSGDQERVVRLVDRLAGLLDRRAEAYAAARAGSITEFRQTAGNEAEARVLLLVDGLGAFREQYESSMALAKTYGRFVRLMAEGRGVGIHIIAAAERPNALPSSLGASVQRRLVLRLAEETAYMTLNVDADVLSSASPPGRGMFGGESNEIQVAVPSGSTTPADQATAIDILAGQLNEQGVVRARGVERLATFIATEEMPTAVAGQPVLGVSDADLEPIGFAPQGAFLLTGMPGSGRTTSLQSITGSLHRWRPKLPMYYFGPKRSALRQGEYWAQTAVDHEAMKLLVAELKPVAEQSAPNDDEPGLVVVVESIADLVSSPVETPLLELIKLVKRNGHLVLAEHETAGWRSSWQIISEIRNAGRGLIMQPDQGDGDLLFRVQFPKVKRADFHPGRGIYVAGGKYWTVQVPFPEAP